MGIEIIQPIDDRLCTLVARSINEEPIGSANPFRHCLVIEYPLPWAPEITASREFPEDVLSAIKDVRKEGEMPLLGVAPDPEYSSPGFTRVLMFRRPMHPFATYEKEEYLVPSYHLVPFIRALLLQTEDLKTFANYKEETSDIRDLMICTHGTHDQCCGKFGYPLYATLREQCANQNDSVRVWRTSHFTGHRFSPTLIDFPEGRFWGNLTDACDIDRLITRESLPDLNRCYRGWAGTPYITQFVERELFRQEGWPWTHQKVSARVTDAWTDAGHHHPDKPLWARIDGNLVRKARIEIEIAENGKTTQIREGIVEFSHMVSTLYDCVKRGNRADSPHFRVTHIA